MTIEEQIKDIKKELCAAMNGVVSAQMRQAGMPYKLIFGVELPRLQSIAQEFTPTYPLAQALWNQNIRECKILATMLMPRDEMQPDLAELWADEMPTAEVAQICTMNLLAGQTWTAELAFQWIASDQKMKQLCGFLMIARLLQQGAELNEWSMQELADQAHSLMPEADLPLKKAIAAVTHFLPTT